MEERPDATPEMVKFIANANAENNRNSAKRSRIVNRLKRKRDEISEALIGIGQSLKSLTEQKADIEAELKEAEEEYANEDVPQLFMRKFGINMWSVNQNPKLTQREVDTAKGEEID